MSRDDPTPQEMRKIFIMTVLALVLVAIIIPILKELGYFR